LRGILAVFVEVCRFGSFSAAARRRSVTHSSIVRRIDALEADLGVLLVDPFDPRGGTNQCWSERSDLAREDEAGHAASMSVS
jgi:regulatory helix-turn-helix LysR family protein